MRKTLLILLLALVSRMALANHWIPDPYQFADNMNVIGVIEINGMEQASAQLEIGAFCDDECRGSEMLAYYAGLDRCLVFLTLYGQYGHVLDFRLYDHATGTELNLTSQVSINFSANAILGSLSEPYVFSFTGGSCVVTTDVQPAEGGTATGGGTFLMGETVTLTAAPAEHYRFLYWQENGETVVTETEYAFAATNDRALTACFEPIIWQIEAEVSPDDAGTVSGAGVYADGAICTLTATPSGQFRFVQWTENGEIVSTSENYAFAVVSDRNLTANFERISCSIEARPYPAVAGLAEGSGTYLIGETCTLTASAHYGYSFAEWQENGTSVSTDSVYVFTVENDRCLIAVFQPDEYEISLDAEPADGGSVEGNGIYHFGDSVTVRAVANSTYYFINWQENGEVVSTAQDYAFAVDGNHHFVATFAQDCYVVTATPEPINGGSITGAGNYVAGTQCQLVAHSAPGYGFDKWTENGVTVSNSSSYSFTVNENHDLTAHFFLVPYEIVAVADPETGGTVDGGGWFYYGDVCTLTAEPAEDYLFTYWSLSGEIVSLEPEISFNVTGDKTYTAHFVYYVDVEEDAGMVSVYPNPARDKVCLHCVGMEKVEAFDVVGRKVLEKDCDSDSVEIGFEHSGLYVVRVIAGNKDWTCKILIEK